METIKNIYVTRDKYLKKGHRKRLSPAKEIKIKRELAAFRSLVGLWENKDTSFFDKK